MIKSFDKYDTNEEWVECPDDYEFEIGEEVKMSPWSRYQYQSSGDKTGKIEKKYHTRWDASIYPDKADEWVVSWKNGITGRVYTRRDLLIKDPNKFSKIKWFKDGKLNENLKNDNEVKILILDNFKNEIVRRKFNESNKYNIEILILDNLKEKINRRGWGWQMHDLIGNVYVVSQISKHGYYITSNKMSWFIPEECAKIVQDKEDKIKWFKDGKLMESLKSELNDYSLSIFYEKKYDDKIFSILEKIRINYRKKETKETLSQYKKYLNMKFIGKNISFVSSGKNDFFITRCIIRSLNIDKDGDIVYFKDREMGDKKLYFIKDDIININKYLMFLKNNLIGTKISFYISYMNKPNNKVIKLKNIKIYNDLINFIDDDNKVYRNVNIFEPIRKIINSDIDPYNEEDWV